MPLLARLAGNLGDLGVGQTFCPRLPTHCTNTIIDNTDPEWLIGFGLELLGVPEAIAWVQNDWVQKRRPPLREYVPYFIFMLSINIFFCLVLPTELLRDVKASHQVDLAYLYYLPFCMVFTSKDRFHSQIVPLFLDPFSRHSFTARI